MPSPYPIAARDALFAVLAESLRSGGPLPGVRQLCAQPALRGHGDYVRERLPRMRRVLGAVSGRGAAAALETGRLLFNAGLFFDCHEYLEGFWREAKGRRRVVLQGLIQAAAAYHKLELDPAARGGAAYLLERGADKLRASPRTSGFLAPLARARRALVREGPARAPRLPHLKKRVFAVKLFGETARAGGRRPRGP